MGLRRPLSAVDGSVDGNTASSCANEIAPHTHLTDDIAVHDRPLCYIRSVLRASLMLFNVSRESEKEGHIPRRARPDYRISFCARGTSVG